MESKNLFIRKSTFEDCPIFARWEQQEFIKVCFTISEERDYNEVAQEFVIRSQDDTKEQFTVIHKEEENAIGRIYLSRIDRENDSVDITRIYIGEEEYLNRGLGEEMMRLLLEYCFIHLHMERVTLDHVPDNKRAAKLYLRLGFQYEGVARHAGKKNGRYIDLHLMSMLRSQYRGRLY